MRNAFIIAACSLLLAGCTAKVVLITEPVDLNFELQEVRGSRIIFKMDPTNPEACYTYGVCHKSLEQYNLPDKQLAQYILDVYIESYETKDKNKDVTASFIDMSCYRGSRVFRIKSITSGQDYKLVVFQVNPMTLEILGDVVCTPVHTPALEMKELSFTFQTKGEVMTITPSDPDCIYYWDYDTGERIYDDYNGAEGFFSHLIDMFDEYGFVEEVYSKGPEEYDFSADRLRVGKEYLIVAGACKDGEVVSDVTVASFMYVKGKIEINPVDM